MVLGKSYLFFHLILSFNDVFLYNNSFDSLGFGFQILLIASVWKFYKSQFTENIDRHCQS